MKFSDIPQLSKQATTVELALRDVKYKLESWASYSPQGIILDPDFQRGDVWTQAQQTAYIEFILRGGANGRDFYWNSPGYGAKYDTPFEIVDGKQRLTAFLKFIGNKLPIFGGMYHDDFEDRLPGSGGGFRFHVAKIADRAELIEWYLALNTGGTLHAAGEIDRVRAMLADLKK